MFEFRHNQESPESVFVNADSVHGTVQAILEISIEQPLQKVLICNIIDHLVLLRHPIMCEVEPFHLQIEFQHLQSLHQKRTHAVPLLCVCFST